MKKVIKEKLIVGLIIIATIILLSVFINGIFLLKKNVEQNNEIISILKVNRSFLGTVEKYSY